MLRTGRFLELPLALALLVLPALAGADAGREPGCREGFLEAWVSFAYPQGRLGVELLPMTPELRESFGLEPDVGVLVTRVAPDSPAAEAGVRAGDVIREAGDTLIRTPRDLVRRVGRAPEGEALALELSRKGKAKQLEVTLRGQPWPSYGTTREFLAPHMGKALHALRREMHELEQRLQTLEEELQK